MCLGYELSSGTVLLVTCKVLGSKYDTTFF